MEVIQRSFNGGILTPEFFAKSDDAKYANGVEYCDNFIVLPHGALINRGGTKFVAQTKYANKKARLIPFKYSNSQQMIIELGDLYARFHTSGLTLLHGATTAWSSVTSYQIGAIVLYSGQAYQAKTINTNKTPSTNPSDWYLLPESFYEVPAPYLEADLFDLTFVQSKDVMTFCHNSYPPHTLIRYGVTDWRFEKISFLPSLQPPSILVSAVNGVEISLGKPYIYCVTSHDGSNESVASAAGAVVNNLNIFGTSNVISWGAISGAKYYNVYLKIFGGFRLLGSTKELTFTDENFAPNPSISPPNYDSPFGENGIKSVQIVNGGTNYGSTPVGGGAIVSVTTDAIGSDYAIADTLTASDPTGSGATFSLTFGAGGSISAVNTLTSGLYYSQVTLTLSTATGSGAKFTANVSPRIYNTPVATVTDATGSGAVLDLVYNAYGTITQCYVREPGKNYTAPSISITVAGGGSGAVFGTIELTGSSYPGCVTYYEQRKCFGGTNTEPLSIWMTKTGTESNISYAETTVLDTDRINFRIASAESAKIKHLIPLGYLIALTDSSEYRISSVNSDSLTQNSFNVRPYSYYGASNVQPVLVGNTAIFNGNRDNKLYQIAYNANGQLAIDDLSKRASHLFRNFQTSDLAVAYSPHRTVYVTRSDGVLICYTYMPEDDVGAYYTMTVDGSIESCSVIRESKDDFVYIEVKRNINGNDVRYIERVDGMYNTNYLDCYLSYSGAPTASISGLTHLAGESIRVIADGYVYTKIVSQTGTISLDDPASSVVCGLPYISEFKTLPVVYNNQRDPAFGVTKTKIVSHVFLRVLESNNISVSADNGVSFFEAKERTYEDHGTKTLPQTGVKEIVVKATADYDGTIVVRQENQKRANILFVVTKFS